MTNGLSAGKDHSTATSDKTVGKLGTNNLSIMAAMSKDPKNVEMGRRIAAAMRECGLEPSDKELARRLKMTGQESAIRNWLNGSSRPSLDNARKIKDLLSVGLDWLYDGDEVGLSGEKRLRLKEALASLQRDAKRGRPPKEQPPTRSLQPKGSTPPRPIQGGRVHENQVRIDRVDDRSPGRCGEVVRMPARGGGRQ